MRVKFYKNLPEAYRTRMNYVSHWVWALAVTVYQWPLLLIHRMFGHYRQYRFETALCLIFKNEGRFLKEWIEYHLLIGVDHFYLYNNNSDDDFRTVLAPYIADGTVTLIDWPKEYAQQEAYEDCYRRFGSEAHWIGYIDADEFVNLQKHNSVKELLHEFRHYPSLIMQWRDFGTSGHIEATDGLVIEEFTAAWPWLCHMGKGWINNDFEFSRVWIHEHWARFMGVRLYGVSDNKLPAPHGTLLWDWGVGRKVYLNHYFSKSYEWYVYKDRKRGDAMAPENVAFRQREGRFEMHELNNFTRDSSIQRWLTLLKLRMNRSN